MSYTSRTNVERRFGAQNVLAWADANNDGNSTTIAAVIAALIDAADARIEDRLRESSLSFQLPVTSGNTTLEFIATDMVGYWLSIPRGVLDYDKDGKPVHRLRVVYLDALDTLEQIATGKLKMEGTN